MAISEQERHRLHQSLDEVIGPDVAAILMSHLPPVGWADVATKHDLAELEGRLTNQMRTAISDLRAELHCEIGGLRSELHAEIGGLRSDVHQSLQSMARTYLLGNIALVLTVVAVAFGAARLI